MLSNCTIIRNYFYNLLLKIISLIHYILILIVFQAHIINFSIVRYLLHSLRWKRQYIEMCYALNFKIYILNITVFVYNIV